MAKSTLATCSRVCKPEPCCSLIAAILPLNALTNSPRAGFFWMSRQIASPSFPVEHILLSQDGLFDALVWMGASSSNQARYAVRLIRYRYEGQW